MTEVARAVLQMEDVELRRERRVVLSRINWSVCRGERWVVLGPNGAGKTSLLQLASTYEARSRGRVRILGETFGKTDIRDLRPRIGYVSQALANLIPSRTRVLDVVAMGPQAKLRPFRERYAPETLQRARDLLEEVRCGNRVDDTFDTLSAGEQQRVQLARCLMTDPELLLLDEPCAGLDDAGREYLVGILDRLAAQRKRPAIVFVTHHVEEVPPSFTHAMLLRDGTVLRQGPLDDVLTPEHLSACFGLPLVLERLGDRYAVRAA